MTELVAEVMVLPDGMPPDDDDVSAFAVFVRWRGVRTETGRGGYAVVRRGDDHLSHRGVWRYAPEPYLQRHFRWASLEEALAAARDVVNTITVLGRTWAQWEAQRTPPPAECPVCGCTGYHALRCPESDAVHV